MSALAPVPSPVGDPSGISAFARALHGAHHSVNADGVSFGRTSTAIAGVWQSRPSSPRAQARLDGLFDLCRTWNLRAAEAVDVLWRYAAALDLAQQTAKLANEAIATYNQTHTNPIPLATLDPPTGMKITQAQQALDELRAAQAACVRVLSWCVQGEGSGAGAVDHRLRITDEVTGRSTAELVAAIHRALNKQPPDLITIEESLRQLRRLAHDPGTALAAITGLGHDVDRIKALPGAVGVFYDYGELTSTLSALGALAARPVSKRETRSRQPVDPPPKLTRSPQEPPPVWSRTPERPPPVWSRMPEQPPPTLTRMPEKPPHLVQGPVQPRPGGVDPPPSADPGQPKLPPSIERGYFDTSLYRGLPGPVLSALRYGFAELGKPYVFAAAGPASFDCSGLTMASWSRAGVALPHLASAQYSVGHHVALGDLRPGDLVYWANNTADPGSIHHVAIYVGHGQVLEAPQTGQVVHIRTIDFSDPELMANGSRPGDFLARAPGGLASAPEAVMSMTR